MFKNKKVRGVLQVVFSLVLLALLVYKVGPAEILRTLAEIDPGWYALALALFVLNIMLRAYRWYLLLRELDERPALPYLIYLYFVGFFFNNFLPSGFGGDVVKVLSLRQTYGRGTDALSSVVMERMTGLLGSSLIAVTALTINAFSGKAHVDVPNYMLWLAFLISMAIPVAFIILRATKPLIWLAEKFPFTRPVTGNARLRRLTATLRLYPAKALFSALLISIPFTLSLVLVQYTIARSLHVDVALPLFMVFVPIIAVVNLLPISFNGLGTREGVYLLLFVPAGIAPDQAIAMSLVFYSLRMLAGIMGGALLAVRSLSQVARATLLHSDS